MKTRVRANSTEINKTPRDIRYIWIVKYPNGSVTTCMSYQTLAKVKPDEVESIMVVDMRDYVVREVIDVTKDFLNILSDWRDNYFDFDFDISPPKFNNKI